MTYIYTTLLTSENYISHHGILGQKWGVRRFQNPDGSLTAAGQKRYSDALRKEYSKAYKSSDSFKTSEEFKKISDELISYGDRESLIKNFNSVYQEMINIGKNTRDFYDDFDSQEYKDMILESKQKIIENEQMYVPKDVADSAKEYARDKGIDIWETKPYDRALEYEIYDGETGTKYEQKWEKSHPEYVNNQKKFNELWKDLSNISKEYVESLLGDYGNEPYEGKKYLSVQSLVSQYLDLELLNKKLTY